ncbi:hypothetical protein QTN25_010261 [Entamoeba marina]
MYFNKFNKFKRLKKLKINSLQTYNKHDDINQLIHFNSIKSITLPSSITSVCISNYDINITNPHILCNLQLNSIGKIQQTFSTFIVLTQLELINISIKETFPFPLNLKVLKIKECLINSNITFSINLYTILFENNKMLIENKNNIQTGTINCFQI